MLYYLKEHTLLNNKPAGKSIIDKKNVSRSDSPY